MIQTVNINVAALPALRGPGSFMVLSQNENGRQIRFRILGSDLPTGCTATFSGTKPDGNVYSTTGTVSGNFVIVQEDIQMTAVAGIWDAKLEIVKGTENIVTSVIRVTIARDPVAGDSIPSDSQLDGIVAEVKYYAEHARSEAYGSPLTAPTKAQMTDHTRVYVYTGSESGMTAGNWYYWNGSAWTSGGVYNAVAVQSDSELNDFSTSPVQNKVIKAALDQIEGAIPEIDATLSVAGEAADAKKTGDEIASLKEDLNAIDERVSELEAGGSDGLSMTAVNLLNTILNEAVYGTDQTTNIDLLYKELAKVRPVSITAELTSRALVGLAYSALEFEITATFDDESTITTDEGYRVLTSGNVVSGSNTVTVSFRGVTTTVTFTAEQVTTYTITNNLTHASTSNNATVVIENDRYAAEITIESGFEVGTFTVTMGGVDVTATVKNGNNIVIDEVTGDVVITVTASAPVYLDPLIRRRYGFDSTAYLCPDNHVSAAARINNSFTPMVSEYPAASDCTISFRIENNTEEDVSVGSIGFALLSGADNDWITKNEYPYYTALTIPVGDKLAPGEYLEGTYLWRAGYQLVCVTTVSNIGKLDINLRGNYVPIKYDEDDSYDRYVYNAETQRVSHTYATQITWYADDGVTSLSGGKTSNLYKITDALPAGTYDLAFRLRNHDTGSTNLTSKGMTAGTADELTASTASIYNSFTTVRDNIENVWMYKRVTVAHGNNTLIPNGDITNFGTDDKLFELYFKEVSA